MRKVSTKWPKIITCVCAVGIVMYVVTSLQHGVFNWNQFSIKLVTYGFWPVVFWGIWVLVYLASGDKKQAVSQTKTAKGQVKWLAFASLAVVLTAIIVVHFSNTPTATRADNRDVAEVYFNRGVAYLEEGAFDLAISDYTKAIEINPRYAEAYYNRGIVYYKKGEPVPAISDFNKAIEINPDFAMAYYNRGFVYAEEDEPVLTISDYTKAIEINPDYAEAYHNRGFTYYEEGARDLAISDYTRAIEINPKLANVHYHRGVAYLEEGAFDLAILDYTKAIEMNPDCAETYFLRGFAYSKKGEPVPAISDFNKTIEINPRDAEAYFFRGVTYGEEGARDLAISDWSKAIEINPREGQYYYYRGVAYAAKDEFDKAWKDVHKAQDLGYQVSPEFIEQLRTSIVLKRKLGSDFPQRTPGAATPGPTPQNRIDPYLIVKQKLNSLQNYFKKRVDELEPYKRNPEVYNQAIARLQEEYDQAKFKITSVKSQLDIIKRGMAMGQIDPILGQEAMARMVLPQEVIDAMFPKSGPK